MPLADFKIQILIVLCSIAFLWLFSKMMKVLWALTILVFILIGLVLTVPALREWVFNFF